MGVTKTGQTYRARYTVKGIRKNVGTFRTKREAVTQLEIAKANDPDVPKDLFEEKIRHNYLDIPVPKKHVVNLPKPTFKERVTVLWQSLVKSLKERNLI